MQKLVLLGAAMVAAGCTDSLQPGSGDDPGSGTGTLHVSGSVIASGGESLLTTFFVRIEKDGVPVTNANVAITSRTGRHVLGTDVRFPGRWTGSTQSYEHVYVLNVDSGVDTIRNVRVEGPPLIVFTSPAEDTTIDPASPLEIQWEPAAADQTSLGINPDGTSLGQIDDDGSFTIPANTWGPNPASWAVIVLNRTNAVVPAGGVEGSRMAVSTSTPLHVCVRPSTLCMD